MRVQRWVQTAVVAACLVGTAGFSARGLAWEQAAGPSTQAPSSQVSATAQGGSATVLVPQAQVVYETVQSVECVQVPVTHMQTLLPDGVSDRDRCR